MTKQILTKVKKIEAKKTGSGTVTCLITGFNSFGKFTSNPSQKIAQTLPQEHELPQGLKIKIDTLVLPTCCKESWHKISGQLAKRRYNHLIMIGLAGSTDRISLERFALNIRDYWIKDNNGHQWEDDPIYKGEAEALRTNLPLMELRDHLKGKDFPVGISNHAGTFICNEVYYHGLRYMKETGKLDSVLFVHVPQPQSLGQALMSAKQMEGLKAPASRTRRAQQIMKDCILEIAGFLATKK